MPPPVISRLETLYDRIQACIAGDAPPPGVPAGVDGKTGVGSTGHVGELVQLPPGRGGAQFSAVSMVPASEAPASTCSRRLDVRLIADDM